MQVSNKEICFFLKRGNRRGMDLLFDRYFESLVLWAVTFLGDIDLSKDIVQDFFVDIWKKQEYKKWVPDTLSAYLYISVRNRCYNNLKKKDPLKDVLSLDNVEMLYDEYQDNKEFIINTIIGEVERLPKRGQEVVKCVYLKGMSYKETAAVLQVSVATVKTHLVRSLKTLRLRSTAFDNFLLFIFLSKK